MFEEKARQQLKSISSNEMVKYEPIIEECAKLFGDAKNIINNIEGMWSGITEISKTSASLKEKTQSLTIM